LAQPKRVLYLTHSAGFRHGSLEISAIVLSREAAADGRLQIVHTEDVSQLSAAGLRDYDALLFFTSGELPISNTQKGELIEWVRGGKGFAGVHSATDTFYQWPEYGELIGARFNGHPWTQRVRIDVEDPAHPSTTGLAPSYEILEEIYQFREFSRERSRVLTTLDPLSVNLTAEGTNPNTEDFPLSWAHRYGQGRVFYSALGHFDETWLDPRFQRTMIQALLCITGQSEADATPFTGQPALTAEGIANAASFTPRGTISPGTAISLFGRNLTTGATMQTPADRTTFRLAGATVKLNGSPIPLLFASPDQINAAVPLTLDRSNSTIDFELLLGSGPPIRLRLNSAQATPGIFTYTLHGNAITLWATGLGPVERQGGFDVTVLQPSVRIGGVAARVLYSGLSPGFPGLYQVNVEIAPGLNLPAPLQFELAGYNQELTVNPLF
jgi:type 1 glutamine amidotransferase